MWSETMAWHTLNSIQFNFDRCGKDCWICWVLSALLLCFAVTPDTSQGVGCMGGSQAWICCLGEGEEGHGWSAVEEQRWIDSVMVGGCLLCGNSW
jgi:hypothetical protein